MKKAILSLMIFGGLFMASCSDDIYDEPRNEDFTESFIELFGPIDENQDWNMAELKSVTVSGAASDVKVYAKDGDHFVLVGNFKDVNDGQTLKFDAGKGVDDFYVVANGIAVAANNNSTVMLKSSNTPGTTSIQKSDSYKEFTYDEVHSYSNRLPERTDNRGLDGVDYNFSYTAE